MTTTPRDRTTERERWPERHPTLTRTTNGVAAVGCHVAAVVAHLGGETPLAVGAGVLGLVLLVGVVWPKFSAIGLLFEAWYWI